MIGMRTWGLWFFLWEFPAHSGISVCICQIKRLIPIAKVLKKFKIGADSLKLKRCRLASPGPSKGGEEDASYSPWLAHESARVVSRRDFARSTSLIREHDGENRRRNDKIKPVSTWPSTNCFKLGRLDICNGPFHWPRQLSNRHYTGNFLG